jgi:hypothetical protein
MKRIFVLIPLLVGCSDKPEVASWVSIEKPPIKIVYVDRDRTITPETVRQLVGQARLFPYEDYQFNTAANIGISNEQSISEDLSQDVSDSFTASD